MRNSVMFFMWGILPVLCTILTAVYIYRKIKGCIGCFKPQWSQKKQRILTVILLAVIMLPSARIYSVGFIILLHVTVFLLITDSVVIIWKKICKKTPESQRWYKIYKSGMIAIFLAAIVLGYGRYNIFHVVRTEYTVGTEKHIRAEGYKIALLADLHYGISLDDAGLEKVVQRIKREDADIVVLDGDIVDENTTLKQMESAFRILGQIKNKYGIYYTYGNHDKNNYTETPNYTKEKLADTIEKNGIHILEDSSVPVNQEVQLIGRADRSDTNGNRKEISSLVGKLNQEQEWIVLDHQPTEYKKVQNAGADMILSGHTHGGQIWPAGVFATLFHFDEMSYGERRQGNLDAIVTSGIAGWGYPIRTEKHSEYVVVNVVPKK